MILLESPYRSYSKDLNKLGDVEKEDDLRAVVFIGGAQSISLKERIDSSIS